MNSLEEAREAVARLCALAMEGRPEALEASASLLESKAGELRRFATGIEPELKRLGLLAGQAAAFYGHGLEPADAAGVYTVRGVARAAPAAGQVRLEG